jgi:hypothetical protein
VLWVISERLVILGYRFKLNTKILEDDAVRELPRHLILRGEGDLEESLVGLLLELHTVTGRECENAERASNNDRERDLDGHDLVLSGGVGSHYRLCSF